MKKMISILFLMIVLCVCTISEANSFSASLTTEEKEIKPGDVISVKLNISDIDVKNGLMALSGKLIYDEKIFETITTNDMGAIETTSLSKMNAIGSWASPIYTSRTKMFVIDANNYITNTSGVLEIQLKVKEDVRNQKTAVKVVEIVASNGEKDINAEDTSINIKIKGSADSHEKIGILVYVLLLLVFMIVLIIGYKKFKQIKKGKGEKTNENE